MTSRPDVQYAVKRPYQPRIRVPDLREAEVFFERVFGETSTLLSEVMPSPPAPGHSIDHSIFTRIGDVVIDSLDPSRYRTRGRQRYPDVSTPQLDTPGGWLVDGVGDAYKWLRSAGMRLEDAAGYELTLKSWPGGRSPLYTSEVDAGMRYALFETFRFPIQPRTPSDVLNGGKDSGPLGVVRVSHHTILSSQPERAVGLFVNLLGGRIVAEWRDDCRGLAGPLVELAGTRYHLASSAAGGAKTARGNGHQARDVYHAITWEVADLELALRHLESVGVVVESSSATSCVVHPAAALGIPWGFTNPIH